MRCKLALHGTSCYIEQGTRNQTSINMHINPNMPTKTLLHCHYRGHSTESNNNTGRQFGVYLSRGLFKETQGYISRGSASSTAVTQTLAWSHLFHTSSHVLRSSGAGMMNSPPRNRGDHAACSRKGQRATSYPSFTDFSMKNGILDHL